MEKFYKELLERMEVLEKEKKTDINDGRILELQLAIVRVQQILLANIQPKNISELEIPIPPPISDFILKNSTCVMGNDGAYYHHSEVCKLLKKYKNEI